MKRSLAAALLVLFIISGCSVQPQSAKGDEQGVLSVINAMRQSDEPLMYIPSIAQIANEYAQILSKRTKPELTQLDIDELSVKLKLLNILPDQFTAIAATAQDSTAAAAFFCAEKSVKGKDYGRTGLAFTYAKNTCVWVGIFVKGMDSVSIAAADETELLKLLNAQRKTNGLSELIPDAKLTQLARLKAQDIAWNGYFDHKSPTYGLPDKMLTDYGVTYRLAGENIAGIKGAAEAHNALMNSENHRQNILNKKYTHVGVAAVNGSKYGQVYVQLFVQK